MKIIIRTFLIFVLCLSAVNKAVMAQNSTPETFITKDMKEKICQVGGDISKSTFLISHIVKIHGLDIFELYNNREVLRKSIKSNGGNSKINLDSPVEQLLAWIEYGNFAVEKQLGYVGNDSEQREKLNNIRKDITYLFETLTSKKVKGLSVNNGVIKKLEGAQEGDQPNWEYFEHSELDRFVTLNGRKVLLTPVLGFFNFGLTSLDKKDKIVLNGCSSNEVQMSEQKPFSFTRPQPTAENKNEPGVRIAEAKENLNSLAFVMRGKADDLGVPATDKDKFKKLDNASISYTKNFFAKSKEAGDSKSETIKADVYLGLGKSFGNSKENYLYGFVGYQRDTTALDLKGPIVEDVVTEDTSDAKTVTDVSALSIGTTYATDIGSVNSLVYSDVGLTLYYTRDFAQKAKFIKTRLFASDLTLTSLTTQEGYCINGEAINLSVIYIGCRVDAFVELSHILDAGLSKDFVNLTDDQYLGIGGQFSILVGFNQLDFLPLLKNLTVNVGYQYMHIVSGISANVSLFKAKASYAVKSSPFQVELWYEDGENFDTFQKLKSLNFGVGVKF